MAAGTIYTALRYRLVRCGVNRGGTVPDKTAERLDKDSSLSQSAALFIRWE